MLCSLEGKKLVDQEKFTKVAAAREDAHLEKAGALVGWDKEIAESRAGIQKLENQIESLTPWLRPGCADGL